MPHPRPGSLPCKNSRNIIYAPVAELADAYGSGPYEGNFMEVQVLSGAPTAHNPNLYSIGKGFGFVVYLE